MKYHRKCGHRFLLTYTCDECKREYYSIPRFDCPSCGEVKVFNPKKECQKCQRERLAADADLPSFRELREANQARLRAEREKYS